jgi:hypothetical protein
LLRLLDAAREQRNLLSYRFPASGLAVFGEDLVPLDDAIRCARLFTELAQLNLACLEGSVRKLGGGPFELIEDDELWRTIRYETGSADLFDDDDHMRVSYFSRKHRRPVALVGLATAGLVEDFFGAWTSAMPDGFDPDRDWDLLLDVG